MNLLTLIISFSPFWGHSTPVTPEIQNEVFKLNRILLSEVNSSIMMSEELFIILVSLLQLKAVKENKAITNYINQAGAVLAFTVPVNEKLEYHVDNLLLKNELLPYFC